MSSITVTEHDSDPVKLTELYKEILESNGIVDAIAKVTSVDPALIGEGAGSIRRNVTVEFENPNTPNLNLFAKLQIQDVAAPFALITEIKAFEKESTFLTSYLDAAKDLCKRKGLSETFVMDIYPKCYYGGDTIIVMENLKVDKNYQSIGKDDPHDWDMACIALNTLARHHAISYAVIQDAGPEKFFQRFPVLIHEAIDKPTWAGLLESWMQNNLKINLKLLDMSKDLEGMKNAADSLRELMTRKKTLCELSASTLKTEPDDLLVLGHGDYWYGNMLFVKDPATNKISSSKAIDFQVLRYNSPAIDVANYLIISTDTEMRQSRFHDLLQYYLTSLNKFADDLGHPINLTIETLLEQYKKKLYIGLIMALTARYGPGAEIMRTVDYAKVTGDWGEFTDKLASEWVKNNPEKAERMAMEIASVLMEYKRLTGT